MNSFSLDESAGAEIRRIFAASNVNDPIARLFERAAADHLLEDVKVAILSNEATDHEHLADLGKRRLSGLTQQELKSRLEVGVHERKEIHASDLFDVGGITFALAPSFVLLLRGYRLTFEVDRFVLRDGDNAPRSLVSIVTRR
jgi:hypothetical protein